MNYAFLRACAVLLALAGVFPIGAAHAAEIVCKDVSMSNLTFGAVDPQSSQTDASATLTFTCRNDTRAITRRSARICFSIGEPGGGPRDPRQMKGAATNRLDFQLYKDPAHAQVWGSQFSGSDNPLTVDITLRGSAVGGGDWVTYTRPMYGRVMAGQEIAVPGDYSSNYAPIDTAITINDVLGASPPNTCSGDSRATFGPFLVSATVLKKCTVTASPLAFGTNVGLLNNAVTATTTLGVQCSRTTPYNVGLDAGQNSGGDINARQMVLGPSNVGYQLYMDAARSIVWGNTIRTDTAEGVGGGMGTGATQTLTVYGTVPPQATPPAGTYEDTVVVTVTY